MSNIKEHERFAELEYCIEQYFNENIYPAMRKVRQELTSKQADELEDYQSSLQGMLRPFAGGIHATVDDSLDTLRITGEWNSKTTEEYIQMCKEEIGTSEDIERNLSILAEEWRNTMIKEIGEERYAELSSKMGVDLASAYIGSRMDSLMVDKLVQERIPKSSMEYIMKSFAENSLFSLHYTLNKSPLSAEIDERSESAYNPAQTEKIIGHGAAFVGDTVLTGGFSSWTRFGAFAGLTIGISAFGESSTTQSKPYGEYIDTCISKACFGSEENILSGFRKESLGIQSHENEYITNLNEKLGNSMNLLSKEDIERFDGLLRPTQFVSTSPVMKKQEEPSREDIPLIIKPGSEEEYKEHQKELEILEQKKREAQQMAATKYSATSVAQGEGPVKEQRQQAAQSGNSNGWGNLMGSLGLDGLGTVGNNLGYVLAMLPDVIFGLFTGKSSSLLKYNNLFPLASVITGLFVRNPLLKMMLVGLGGLNLFNKAGQEAIIQAQGEGIMPKAQTSAYKKYEDEPLNPRVTNPQLKGNVLIAEIDRVPVTIRLPESAVKAYQEGALPLNTLINAVVKKNDQAVAMAQENYNQTQKETITRTRGI